MRRELVVSVQQGGIITASGYKRPIGPCSYKEGDIVYTDGNFVVGYNPVRNRGLLPVWFAPATNQGSPTAPEATINIPIFITDGNWGSAEFYSLTGDNLKLVVKYY